VPLTALPVAIPAAPRRPAAALLSDSRGYVPTTQRAPGEQDRTKQKAYSVPSHTGFWNASAIMRLANREDEAGGRHPCDTTRHGTEGAQRCAHQGHCAGQLPLMAQPRLHHPTATRKAVRPSASALVPGCMTGRLVRRIAVSPPCLVPRWLDKTAAKKLLRQLLKGLTYVPRVIMTDKRRSGATVGSTSARLFARI
jgi:hypothetical protein